MTIKASPFTIYHELESAYVLGTFRLKPVASGFVIVGESQPTLCILAVGRARAIHYIRPAFPTNASYDLARPAGRWVVELGKWYGSVAEVVVNGKSAGYIAYQPWRCDVTEFIKAGTNTVEVRVIGTLKNTLGPHHNGTMRGSAWPASFQKAPENGPPAGSSYDTIDYGLFEPFTLRQIIEESDSVGWVLMPTRFDVSKLFDGVG